MKRREFIFKSIAATATATTAAIFGKSNKIFAQTNTVKSKYDLVAIKGGEPDEMFAKGIIELGGMGMFVKKGQKVVVKPNMGWDAVPERAANTNPKLVGEIVKQCLQAGASDVFVFDHTCNNWTYCYKNSGIEKAVKDAGGKMIPGNSEVNYKNVKIPSATVLKETQIHEIILNSDVFINVPTLKHHHSTKLSICMKNLMGIVWDRGFWHQNDLHRCVAEFAEYKKPTLNVVDAYNVLKRNGPQGVSVEDVSNMKYQVISTDIVAADAASAKIFGVNPDEIKYINYAFELNVGQKDLKKINIKRISI